MFWKLLIKILRCRSRNYLKTVPVGEKVYIIDIHAYVPVEQEIRQWNNNEPSVGKVKKVADYLKVDIERLLS